MVLRMKNFNIFKVHWKIRLLGGGGSQKTIYRGDCLKRGCLGHFVDLMGGLGKTEGGGLIPQCTLCSPRKMYCQIQDSFILFRVQRLTYFQSIFVQKNHVVLTIVHINVHQWKTWDKKHKI